MSMDYILQRIWNFYLLNSYHRYMKHVGMKIILYWYEIHTAVFAVLSKNKYTLCYVFTCIAAYTRRMDAATAQPTRTAAFTETTCVLDFCMFKHVVGSETKRHWIRRYCVHLKFSTHRHCNVPEFKTLVGVGVTDTVTVLVIIIISVNVIPANKKKADVWLMHGCWLLKSSVQKRKVWFIAVH